MAIDHKIAFSIAYGERAPKSVCTCKHSGDGAHSDHKDTVQRGHGACRKCKCEKFSWAAHHELFARALAKVK